MYYYFSSETPVATKINGVYFGILSRGIKFINIDETNPPLIEILPLNGVGLPFNFVPNQEFLISPPQNTSVVDLDGGYLIKLENSPLTQEFKIIEQQRFGRVVVTVFNEGGLKISIDSPNGFIAESLSLPISSAQISVERISNTEIICVNIKGKTNFLNLYSVFGEPQNIYSNEVDDYSFNGYFNTIKKYCDMAKHTIKTCYELKDSCLTVANREITKNNNFNIDTLSEKIIPYAFLEELLVKGDISSYLSSELLPNADRLNEYFGNFIGICPPPIFKDENLIGLVYKNGERKYHIKYVVFDVFNKKLTNIKIL